MRSTSERRISAVYLSKVCHLLAVFRSHIRMKQDRLFLGPGEQRFQLFAPQKDAREIVFASDGGTPSLIAWMMFARCLPSRARTLRHHPVARSQGQRDVEDAGAGRMRA
jgi:hypothetical protein